METIQQQLDSLDSTINTFCLNNWYVVYDATSDEESGARFIVIKRKHRRGGNRRTFYKNQPFFSGVYSDVSSFLYGLYLGTPRSRTGVRKSCPDCGEFDKSKGHMDCQFPND